MKKVIENLKTKMKGLNIESNKLNKKLKKSE